MTEKEIRTLAIDAVDGKIFGTWQIKSSDISLLGSIFLVIALCEEKQIKQWQDDNVAHFYEYMEKASPMGVNGYPIFGSLRTMTEDVWEKFIIYTKEYKKQKDSFLKEENNDREK